MALGGALENQSKSGSPRGAISWPTGGPSAVLSLPTPAVLITSTRPESARLPLPSLACLSQSALIKPPACARSCATPLSLSRCDPALTRPQRDAASRNPRYPTSIAAELLGSIALLVPRTLVPLVLDRYSVLISRSSSGS